MAPKSYREWSPDQPFLMPPNPGEHRSGEIGPRTLRTRPPTRSAGGTPGATTAHRQFWSFGVSDPGSHEMNGM